MPDMEFRAAAKYMRVSPQKARLVLDLIKGRRVEEAMNTLMFTNKRVAGTVQKLLRSALENANFANTEKGVDVDVDNLYVKRAVANDAPRMKRIRPAPMGRAYRYVRRYAHLEIALAERARKEAEGTATVVGEEQAAPAKPAKKARPKTAAKSRSKAKAKAAGKKFAGKGKKG